MHKKHASAWITSLSKNTDRENTFIALFVVILLTVGTWEHDIVLTNISTFFFPLFTFVIEAVKAAVDSMPVKFCNHQK